MEIEQDEKEGFGVLLKQGAEARIFESTFLGRRSIVKERFSKKYRHPVLDSKLTLKRLNADYLFAWLIVILCAVCKFPSNLDDPKYLRKGLSKVITVTLHILPGLTDEFYVVMQEARCMTKARRLGVYTPALYAMDPLLYTLTLEYVEGPAVKEVLLAFGEDGIIEERLDDLATQIGRQSESCMMGA
ncbi:EKC/KEOPS complex subunit bud32 [Cinnamomum micranthum f. kanehirae]|uniref:non-specific serine/threonine protein kinase n=1 Tax=Cinnamomum micranthum f. kanehirae TaxID=337451 RepID=A0A443PDT7_9MAGN|nr:EKC/KEOPS complex subunit bud32 [Cinnamomum micranthum f. kanehirae]